MKPFLKREANKIHELLSLTHFNMSAETVSQSGFINEQTYNHGFQNNIWVEAVKNADGSTHWQMQYGQNVFMQFEQDFSCLECEGVRKTREEDRCLVECEGMDLEYAYAEAVANVGKTPIVEALKGKVINDIGEMQHHQCYDCKASTDPACAADEWARPHPGHIDWPHIQINTLVKTKDFKWD